MPTLKEMADEYVGKTDHIHVHARWGDDRRTAYLAGAKDMHALALKEIRAAESWADADGRVQKLIPES